MRVKSILNRLEENNPFVCQSVRWAEEELELLDRNAGAGAQPTGLFGVWRNRIGS
ncbi:MAG TPA: hypothetical protein VGZ29_02845 [Terriglobia bacterium]|nr:hypothetical protein [Terriglobia bacterium]